MKLVDAVLRSSARGGFGPIGPPCCPNCGSSATLHERRTRSRSGSLVLPRSFQARDPSTNFGPESAGFNRVGVLIPPSSRPPQPIYGGMGPKSIHEIIAARPSHVFSPITGIFDPDNEYFREIFYPTCDETLQRMACLAAPALRRYFVVQSILLQVEQLITSVTRVPGSPCALNPEYLSVLSWVAEDWSHEPVEFVHLDPRSWPTLLPFLFGYISDGESRGTLAELNDFSDNSAVYARRWTVDLGFTFTLISDFLVHGGDGRRDPVREREEIGGLSCITLKRVYFLLMFLAFDCLSREYSRLGVFQGATEPSQTEFVRLYRSIRGSRCGEVATALHNLNNWGLLSSPTAPRGWPGGIRDQRAFRREMTSMWGSDQLLERNYASIVQSVDSSGRNAVPDIPMIRGCAAMR